MRFTSLRLCLLACAVSALAAKTDHSRVPFAHPGILLNRAQLDLIKQRVAAGIEPQKTAFAALLASPLADRNYTPSPRATVECGPFSKPDLGCKDERRDATAAYSQALAWHITGHEKYARNAIRIMNAWAGTLTGGHTNENGPVQAAWTGAVWPRAAEIIRYTSTFWAKEDIARFSQMLVTQYVPSVADGSDENGNKELAMSEALIAIGVFNDNRLTFAHGVKYNHFHLRRGVALPNMARVLPTNRPTKADLNHMVWETLTHGDVGAVGLPPIPSKP